MDQSNDALQADVLAAEVAERPDDIGARLRWSRCLAQLGRHKEAQAALSDGPAPYNPRLLIELSAQYRRLGQFDAAETTLHLFAEHHPNDPRVLRARAALSEAVGDHEGAERTYATDVGANPKDSELRLRWIRCLMRLGRESEALAAVSDGLQYAPTSAELLARQTLLLLRTAQFAAADASLALLERHHPDHVQLPQFRGRLAEAFGNLEEAQRVFAADAAAFPDDAARRVRWVNCLRKSGNISEALKVLTEQPSLDAAERKLQVECLLETGQWKDVPPLLDAWPETNDAKEWLTKERLRMRLAILRFDHAAAFTHASAMLARAPDDASAGIGFTRAAAATFQPELAWKALVSIPRKSPDGGRPRRGAGALRSLVGQIVNDLRLRSHETAELADATKLGEDKLVERAAAQLRADTGNFGAALGLLIGLGRVDGFGTASSFPIARANFKIPGILHQFWDKDTPPQDVQRLMTRTKKVNPYFSYRRWNDVAARQFLSTFSQLEVRRAYKVARHVAMRADIFRLAVLFAEGGIYLDADDYCAAPLRALLPPDAGLVCYQDEFGSIGNNFLAAVPGHPIVGAALQEAVRSVLGGATESLWLVTGPGLMSRVVAHAIAQTPNLRPPPGLAVLPLRVFHGIVHPHRRVSYKMDGRHWIRAA